MFKFEEFGKIKEYLSNLSKIVYVGNNHKLVAEKIDKLIPDIKVVNIVNIDQHHDLWEYSGKLDSGNWINYLSTKYTINLDWRYLPISKPEEYMFESMKPASLGYKSSSDLCDVLDREYDFVFLIQSPEFSPSIMQHKFRELVSVCRSIIYDDKNPPVYTNYRDDWDSARQLHTGDYGIAFSEDEVLDEDEDVLVLEDFSPYLKWKPKDLDPTYFG